MASDGVKVALDKPIPNIILSGGTDDAKATQLFNMNYVNDNFKIFKCVFKAESLCDIQARAPNGEIIENDFAGDGGQICLGSAAGVSNMGPKSGYILINGNK